MHDRQLHKPSIKLDNDDEVFVYKAGFLKPISFACIDYNDDSKAGIQWMTHGKNHGNIMLTTNELVFI